MGSWSSVLLMINILHFLERESYLLGVMWRRSTTFWELGKIKFHPTPWSSGLNLTFWKCRWELIVPACILEDKNFGDYLSHCWLLMRRNNFKSKISFSTGHSRWYCILVCVLFGFLTMSSFFFSFLFRPYFTC